MRPTLAIILASLGLLAGGCARTDKAEEDSPPALERAQEKLRQSMEQVDARLAEGKEEAKKAVTAALERWEDLRPKAEQAVAAVEERFEKLAKDTEALKRLPPEALDQVRARLAALREKLAEANAAHEQGDTDLAVEKADDVQQESQAIEEMLVERPDP